MGRVCGESTILGTDPSTFPVIEPAMETGRPDRVCEVNFSTPAPVMTLVEIVRPLTAGDETIAECPGLGRGVRQAGGLIVNAPLFPYLNNPVRPLEGGVATKDDIDAAMKGGCGFPMGPFALLDLVGLDTSLSILDGLDDEFRDPNSAAVPLLRRMVSVELIGRRSGRGFYGYHET